jgi:hypothetical protein
MDDGRERVGIFVYLGDKLNTGGWCLKCDEDKNTRRLEEV